MMALDCHVITGLVPVIPIEKHSASQHRDGRGEPGHDDGRRLTDRKML